MCLKSWWKRKFNAEIIDVFEVGVKVFLAKQNKISKLDKGTFYDEGEMLEWKFLSQRLVSHHEFLLKRSRVTVTPLNHELYSGKIFCGQVEIPLPIPDKTIRIYENESPIYDNATEISKEGTKIHRFKNSTISQITQFNASSTGGEGSHQQNLFIANRKRFNRKNYLTAVVD